MAENKKLKLDPYDTTKWDDTEKGKTALDAYNTASKAVTGYGDFKFSQQGWLDDIMKNIKSYGEFSYDLNGDALYQQYKDKFTQQGKMAMADTMGQAAAMTGGYGNSYAQSVGQQAYQAQLQNLNDVVPELYQLALDRYNMGKEDLYNQYGLASTERQNEYGVYQDKYGRLTDAYGVASDAYYNGANMFHTEQSNQNSVTSQKISQAGSKAQQMIDKGIMPDAATLEAWGVSEETATSMVEVVRDAKQEGIDERNRAEARDIAMTLIASGVDVPNDILKISGLTKSATAALQEAFAKTATKSSGSTVSDLTKISDTVTDLLENYGKETATAYAYMMVQYGHIEESDIVTILDLADNALNGGEIPGGADVTVEDIGGTLPKTEPKTEEEEEEEKKKKTGGTGAGASVNATFKTD